MTAHTESQASESATPEMDRLLKRLCEDPEKVLLNFGVTWGDKAADMTAEERAAAINRVLDQVSSLASSSTLSERCPDDLD